MNKTRRSISITKELDEQIFKEYLKEFNEWAKTEVGTKPTYSGVVERRLRESYEKGFIGSLGMES